MGGGGGSQTGYLVFFMEITNVHQLHGSRENYKKLVKSMLPVDTLAMQDAVQRACDKLF